MLCKHCGKWFLSKKKKYCSRECNGKSKKDIILSEEVKLKISKSMVGKNTWMKNRHHSEESKKKMSTSHKDIPKSEEHKKHIGESHIGMYPSEKTREKLSKNHWDCSGENGPNWKGGISFLPYCFKFNKELKELIRERDNRICQLCDKIEEDAKLSVHHIHYDKENCEPDLISLCRVCNSKVNYNRDYYEKLFMNMLNNKSFLFWKRNSLIV